VVLSSLIFSLKARLNCSPELGATNDNYTTSRPNGQFFWLLCGG
jgi:hypothetical protein